MNIGITVTGAKEIERMLSRLERKETSKIARTETREANKNVMRPAIGSKAIGLSKSQGHGMGLLIAKNLAVRAMTKMHKGSYGSKVIIKNDPALVGYTKGSSFDISTRKQVSGKRSWIPSAIEYGHASPGDAGGVKVAEERPFQRQAYEETKRPIVKYLSIKMIKAIERAARVR